MSESLRYVKAERVTLKGNSEFNEAWLQREIGNDPSLLGLGENVYVAGKEIRQPQGGRLDLLLVDRESETRYEVELMLGETDPSHIIRCIEYWDVERKRYPHFDHVAVLVAETVNSRFLNVIGLFNSVIPIIAMQVSALKIGDSISLSFAKILDVVRPGQDEDDPSSSSAVGRKEWESWSSKESMQLFDQCFGIVTEISTRAQPNYRDEYIGVMQGNVVDNYILFAPRKNDLRVWSHRLTDNAAWKQKMADNGIHADMQYGDKFVFSVSPQLLSAKRGLIKELIQEAYNNSWSKKH